jgi:predicted hotdog family 3-hydroxylacyl-ACP dehydratase
MSTGAPDWPLRVPHQGAMRLIDAVVEYNAERILCRADPRRSDHPLARDGAVSAIHSIEYAAQAAALHRALQAPPQDGPRSGWLLQVREAVFEVDRLDTLDAPMDIEATCLLGGSDLVRYRYAICSGAVKVGSGELTLMLEAR